MGLIAYEIKKTFCIPALWAFIVLSLALNGLLILGNDDIRDYFLVENGIEKNVIKMRSGDEVINAPENIFVGYDTGALEAFYVEIVKESPTAVEWIQRKYSLLQPRVEHLAQSGAALDHYAGNATYESHQFLFGTLMRAMLAESSICAMLIVLYLMGYEQLNRTEGIVCASPIGRRLWGKKLAAAMLSAEALYVFVVGMTLLFYFSLWDYSGIWGDSVSSRFNYLTDMLYKRPFLTWGDFTIGGYLAAFVVTMGNIILYGIPFLRQNPLIFKDFGLESLWSGATPWFDWTYGMYLLALAALIVSLSMAAALLTVFLSQYSANYIPMLLKALPLFVVLGAMAGSWLMDGSFYFRKLWQNAPVWGFCGMEVVLAFVLLVCGIVLCAYAVRRQRWAEL